jgi:hypothetical protein
MLKIIVSACAFTMLVFAGTVSAQDRLADRTTVNAMVGIGVSRAGTSTDALASVGVKALDYMSINAEAGTLSFKPYGPLTGIDRRAYRIGGHVRFASPEESFVRPYFVAGLGSLVAKRTAGGSHRDLHLDLGLGFDFWPTRYLGVGMSYRTFFVDNGTNHYFTSGLVIGKR